MAQIDINQAQCIKSAEYIGRTEYHNICNGTMSIVQWGTVDWCSSIAAGVLIGAVLVFLIGFIIFLGIMVLSDLH